MKSSDAISVGDILKAEIKAEGQSDNFARHQICYLWSEVVGPVINKATVRRYVEGDVLHVYLTSASLKNELAFTTDRLIDALNNAVGSNVISKIVFH